MADNVHQADLVEQVPGFQELLDNEESNAAPALEVETEVAAEQKTEDVKPDEDFLARIQTLEDENKRLREPLQQYEGLFRQLEEEELKRYTEEVTSKLISSQDESGKPVLEPKDEQVVRQMVADAVSYKREKASFDKLNVTATALDLAYDIVGDRGSVEDLKKVAGELVSLGDVKLMEKWVPHLQQARRNQVAETRGPIDRVTTGTPAGGSATDFASLEREFAFHENTMSPQRMDLYVKLRAQRKERGFL